MLPVSRTKRTASAFCSAVNFLRGLLFSDTARSLGIVPDSSELSTRLGEGQLYLALRRFEKKWSRALWNWSAVLGQLAIFFKGRIPAL